jgi:hypothetical protein
MANIIKHIPPWERLTTSKPRGRTVYNGQLWVKAETGAEARGPTVPQTGAALLLLASRDETPLPISQSFFEVASSSTARR